MDNQVFIDIAVKLYEEDIKAIMREYECNEVEAENILNMKLKEYEDVEQRG